MTRRMSTVAPLEIHEYSTSLADRSEPHIRLLTLLPHVVSNDLISCTLAEHTFDERCPPYETLSYVWGDRSHLRTIQCQGNSFMVTSNLYNALVALRNAEPRLLWVDQITINQHDDAEKTQQVAMMCEIYSRSCNTIAWLGHDGRTAEKAIPTIRRFAYGYKHFLLNIHKLDKSWMAAKDSGLDMSIKISRNLQAAFAIAAPSVAEVEAVNLFLQNPWFRRVWILQEAAVSKTLVLQVGHETISFDLVIVGVMALHTVNFSTRWSSKMIQNMRLLSTIANLRQDVLCANDQNLEIARLIYVCGLSDATDDRDRFYALYGLCSTPLSDLGLVANYSVPPARALGQALGQAFVTILQLDNSLRLLELTERSSDSGLPSWIPSARKRTDPKVYPLSTLQPLNLAADDCSFVSACERIVGEDIRAQLPRLDWQALKEGSVKRARFHVVSEVHSQPPTTVDYLELENNDTLCLHGQLLDRIEEVSATVLRPANTGLEFGSFEHDDDWSKVDEDVRNGRAPTSWEDHKNFWRLGARHLKKSVEEPRNFLSAVTRMDEMVMLRTHTKYYKSQDAILEAYRRTLCAGKAQQLVDETTSANMSDAEASRGGSVAAFNDWRKSMEPVRQIDRVKRRLGYRKPVGTTSMMAAAVRAHVAHDVAAEMFKSNALSPLFGRRLAWTAKGHLALVPATAVVGDHVYALRGNHMPFVLQACGVKRKMLGPTYVDGMINGQLCDKDAYGLLKII